MNRVPPILAALHLIELTFWGGILMVAGGVFLGNLAWAITKAFFRPAGRKRS